MGCRKLIKSKFYGVCAAVFFIWATPLSAIAWDYAQAPLVWQAGASPNVALMIDDSTSMHYQVISESYRRAKAANPGNYTLPNWYVCTGYDNNTKRCTSVVGSSLNNMSGISTANPAERGITIHQEALGATVPRYVYKGNGIDDEVPGAALCNVHKNPGDAGFYLGQSGSVANWTGSVTADDIGVLLSRTVHGNGINDACVRWRTATTGIPGGVDEYTVYPGEYAQFLLEKHAGVTPRSLDFSNAAEYPIADPDTNNFVAAIDDKVIPDLTRLESARAASQKFIRDNYKTARIGLFSLDSEMDRACAKTANPEVEKEVLLGLVDTLRATEQGSPLARTQTTINNYFKGYTSPIQYRCQKNYSVVLTDGEPDNDTGSLDAVAQLGYDTDAKPFGLDIAGGQYQTTELNGVWAKQNVIPYTVGLGLENNLLKRTPLVNRISIPPGNIANNSITVWSHGLNTGSNLEVISGAAPSLSAGNLYYVAKVDGDKFKLAGTQAKSLTCAAGIVADCLSFSNIVTTMVISTGPAQALFPQNPDQIAAFLSASINAIFQMSVISPTIATNFKSLGANSLVYQTRFNTGDWSGEVAAYPVDSPYGDINPAPMWSTKSTLDSPAERGALLTWNDATHSGVTFDWPNLSNTQKNALVSIDALNWLKGSNIATPGFRSHSANGLMGDVANANLLYVAAQDYGYSQLPVAGNTGAATYAAFRAANTSRTPMLFVGANDGMLHGFNANTGAEKVAFIPNGVYEEWNDNNKNNVQDVGEIEKKLFNLTQENQEHRFLVDGQTVAGDAFVGNAWKTYLVGGLGTGGRSVYALDITDTTFSSADVKWEFSHAELGRTFGTPVIARFADNQWYAVFANGPDSASSKSSVFVVNLANPADYHILSTNLGNAAAPNGMMSVQVKLNSQRTATAIYAGDLQGRVWKFDVSTAGAFPSASLLFTAKDVAGKQQAITGGITLGENTVRPGTMLYFGTGKYFEKADANFTVASSPQIDSFYGVFDDGFRGDLSRSDLVLQAFSALLGGDFRSASSYTVNYFSSNYGWYIDLLNNGIKEGERVFTSPVLHGGHVFFSSMILNTGDKCVASGSGFLNVLDAMNGSQPDEPVLDVNGDGLVDYSDFPVSSQKHFPLMSAPVLIENGLRDYAFFTRNQSAKSVAIALDPLLDSDNDGLVDTLDADDDNDGVLDFNDRFPLDVAEFLDTDNDNIGNNADADDDNDGIADISDPLPLGVDGSADFDGDGINNATDPDDDNDGVDDIFDVFPRDATGSVDSDNDGIENGADTDDDNDGVVDVNDAFPFNATESADSDNDGVGNNADDDGDNDGVNNVIDLFPLDGTEAYDFDLDGTGNNADADDDNDGAPDISDAFPFNAAETIDTDYDGTGNNTDTDDDNDGVPDASDALPLNARESVDSDADGIGNRADADDDNDGVKDYSDLYPLDPTESIDSDEDGIGNNADTDDDNDGLLDEADPYPLVAEIFLDLDGDYQGSSIYESSMQQ